MPDQSGISPVVLSVIVGVGTGVIANMVTSLFLNVWLPAYRNYVYQGLRVGGDWTIIQHDTPVDGEPLSTIWVLSATLRQKSYVVSGVATATRVEGNRSADVINYEINGYIYDRLVGLTFKSSDRSKIAYSAFLLEAKGDGTQMVGYRSFYGLRKGAIRSVECTWRRGGHEVDVQS